MRLDTIGGVALSVLVCGAVLAPDVMAQRDGKNRNAGQEWVQLGCQEVSFRGRDRDTIQVGRREGRFQAIRLSARGNDVEIRDLKVVYANGNPDDIDVQRLIRDGRKTDALDLKGDRGRAIDRIEVVYRQRDDFNGRTTVCAEGLPS